MDADANNSNNKQAWTLPNESLLPDDPLANCLVLLTRMQHRPFSLQSLTAGLPLESSRLTPELFVRAAARADISAHILKRPLDKISNLTLPAVLLLQDGQACILLETDNNGRARVVFPEAGAGEDDVALADLEARYTGFAIFVKPAFRFDQRSDQSFVPKPKHWFWGTVRTAWPIYSEVLVASLLVNLFALVMPVFSFPLSPIMSLMSRKHEFEADAYAAAQTRSGWLVSALVKLYRDNASTLTPDPLYSSFYDSHPPAALRVAKLQTL